MGPLLPIFLTVLVDVFALTLLYPLLPTIAQSYGASELLVGVLFASYSACQFVSGPILGHLSDRFGRKPTLLLSQIGTCIGLLVIAFTHRIELLFFGRMLDGLTAGNLTIAQAYIADVTRPEDRTRSFALIGIAFGLGFLFGPFISGVLAKHVGPSAPVLLAAGMSALSVVLTATLLPRVTQKQKSSAGFLALGATLRAPVLRTRLFEMFFFAWSFSTVMSGLTLFLERRLSFEVDQVGYVFAFSGLVGAVFQGGVGRIAKRIGDARLAAFGLAGMLVGYALLAPVQGWTLLLVASAIATIGNAAARPALTARLSQAASAEDQGLVLGASQAMNSLAQVVGPILGGAIIGRGFLSGWALWAAALAAVAIVVHVSSRDTPKAETTTPPHVPATDPGSAEP